MAQPSDVFLTVYSTKWDELSSYHMEAVKNFSHKVIDIDENLDIAEAEKIKAVPTTQIYDKKGNLLATKLGAANEKLIREWIEEIKIS